MVASPSVPPRDLDLVLLLSQASHELNLGLAARLEAVGVSVREYCVLAKALEGPRTQRQLADLANLDKTTMVVTLDGLERSGLAERQALPEDRRARVVVVTPAGEKVVVEARGVVAGYYDGVLATLPAGQRAALVDGLVRLVESLRSARDGEAPESPVVRRARAR